jgi:hypothetical protein
MNEHEPVGIAKSDLRLLYAKINAYEALLRTIMRALADSSDDPVASLESLRSAAMEEGDVMTRRAKDPNPHFVGEGMLETLHFIAQTFANVKPTSG